MTSGSVWHKKLLTILFLSHSVNIPNLKLFFSLALDNCLGSIFFLHKLAISLTVTFVIHVSKPFKVRYDIF